ATGAPLLDPSHNGQQGSCAPLPSLHDSRILIATVVDPEASGLKAHFDRQLEAIIRGIEASGYQRSRFWMPWGPQGRSAGRGDRAGAGPEPSCASRIPGIMLFRPSSDRLDDPALVLLLVGETPTWGVHKRALFTSLNLSASNAVASGTPSHRRI